MKAPTTWYIAVMSEESHTSVWRYAARRGLGPTYMNGGTNWQRENLIDMRWTVVTISVVATPAHTSNVTTLPNLFHMRNGSGACQQVVVSK